MNIYAIIKDSVVSNVIILSPGNAKDLPNAVTTNGLPVHIGDSFIDNKFYRDGVDIETLLTPVIDENTFNIEESYQDAIQALETLGYTEEE